LKTERFVYNNLPKSSQTHGGIAEEGIKKHLSFFSPNVVSLSTIGAPNATVAQKWATENNIPCVATVHSHPENIIRHSLVEMGYPYESIIKIAEKTRQRIQRLSSELQAIIVRSSVSQIELQKYGLQGNFKVLRGGVDKDTFCPSESEEEVFTLREKFGLDIKDILLLFVGRFCPAKSSDSVIQILRELRNINKNIKLVVVGDYSHYKFELRELKNTGVHFLGELKKQDVADVMKTVDIGIAPSTEETFGQGIAEMMSSELVCAVPNIGGHMEFARTNSSLMLDPFNKEKPENWVNIIYHYLINPHLRKNVGEMARKQVNTINESYQHFIDIHKEVYENFIAPIDVS